MKHPFSVLALVGTQILAFSAYAQTPPHSDKEAVRAVRRTEGIEAAHSFMPGEGDPKPEPRARVAKATRASARKERAIEGAEATKEFLPGEGDPRPAPSAKLSREERAAGRRASRSEVAKANKAGGLPSFDDNYGGK